MAILCSTFDILTHARGRFGILDHANVKMFAVFSSMVGPKIISEPMRNSVLFTL